ncbi:MAG: AmmeMemoRadiSam system protein A [Melioribacteraceae bacterium]|nr:AmmeMemoRadiSam system protein A [Melioribacteraceae bacterium]
MNLSDEEKTILLKAARDSIAGYFDNRKSEEPDYTQFPQLKLNAGAFVTLTINKKLRGCIGYIQSDDTLYKTVVDAARQAAFGDPRFVPVDPKELSKISIEISVLSPPFKMNSYDEIELGKHGLIVEEMGRRGLLLPQVPTEHGMNKDEYLSALCQKAGLPSTYWKKRTLKIKMFTATIFSDKE